jgi:hypothetical protein
VYLTGTTTLASLYSDNGVTALTNPTTSSDTGRLQFYAADGRYDIVCTKSGYTTTTIADVLLEDPANAGDLLYLPSGTGAVTRGIQGKLRETVSVTDFGAVGDGTTDDTAAIQAALNAGFKAVYVPLGSFKFSTLTMPTTFGFVLFGSGTSSVLVQTGAGIKWPSTGTGDNGYYEGYIRDLSFTGTNGTGNTIDTQYAGGVTLQDLYFGNIPVGYNSIAVNGNPSATGDKYSHDVRLRNIQIYSSTAGNAGIYMGTYSADSVIDSFIMNGNSIVPYCIEFAAGSTSCAVSNSHPYNALTNIVKGATGAVGCTFTNVSFDNVSSGLGDLVSLTGWNNTIFNGCWFEANKAGRSSVTLANCTATLLTGCRFESAVGGTYAVNETGTSDYTQILGATFNGSVTNFTNPVFSFTGIHSLSKNATGITTYGQQFSFVGSTSSAVAAGSTVFLGCNGAQTAYNASAFMVPLPTGIYVLNASISVTAAPGAGQTYTFTLLNAGSAMTADAGSANPLVITGTSTFNGSILIALSTKSTGFAAQFNQLSIQMVSSAGAAATNVRYAINAAG